MKYFTLLAVIAYCLICTEAASWKSLKETSSHLEEAVVDVFPEAVSKLQDLWVHFKTEFKREYTSALEEIKRFYIFCQNYIRAIEHNIKYHRNESSYFLGINNLSDWTHEELKKLRGYKAVEKCKLPKQNINSLYSYSEERKKAPKSIDWRTVGAVTPVKDQGQCGSCWAFSTTGSVEGQHFVKNGKLVDLSEQQLVDCSATYGNNGCNGGLMDYAFNYLKDNGGDDSEDSYPYVSGKTGKAQDTCRFKTKDVAAIVTGFKDLPSGNEKAVMEAVGVEGPVSIAINAAVPSFMSYQGGVYDDPECTGDPSSLDHGVLLVGYGHEAGKDYWLIKNSWGPGWGENGYIKIRRNHGNTCGVATAASYPLV